MATYDLTKVKTDPTTGFVYTGSGRQINPAYLDDKGYQQALSYNTVTPAVITSKPAQNDVNNIISQHTDLTNSMQNQASTVAANTTQRNADAIAEAERQAKIKEVQAQIAQKQEELRLKQMALNDGEDEGVELTGDAKIIDDSQKQIDQINLDLDTEYKKAFNALNQINEGTFQLTAGEQAQVNALQSEFAQMIANQKLTNITDQGLANVRGYMKGSAEYDPTFQARTIGSVIAGGVNRVTDLQVKAANAVAELTAAIQEKKYNRVKELWDSYSTYKTKQKDAIQKVIDDARKEMEKVSDKKEKVQEDINKVLAVAIKNGADQATISAIRNSRNEADALVNAGSFLHSESEILDAQYKKAQIAKIYSDMQQSGPGGLGGLDIPGVVAYANEYAATGKIPTGLPKGTFGVVAQVAKEMPKQKGQILSSSTGITPTGDATLQGAVGALYSAIDLAKQLRDLDEKRWSGVVSGSFGKVFGSDDQQRYVDLKDQIIDLLSRARSGAALTANEEKRYSGMLPGRFSEPFGLGVDTDVRIDNFINSLSSDLTNKASAQGWVINGFSKVRIGDDYYTVGDIITNDQGQHGRVNADGSITIL